MAQEDDDARELYEAEEGLDVPLVARHQAPGVLQPLEEAHDLPAATVAPERTPILYFEAPGAAVRGDERDAVAFRTNAGAAALDGAIAAFGKPTSIACDHGTQFMSCVLEDWAFRRDVQSDFTRPGQALGQRLHQADQWEAAGRMLNIIQVGDIVHARNVIASCAPTTARNVRTAPRGTTR